MLDADMLAATTQSAVRHREPRTAVARSVEKDGTVIHAVGNSRRPLRASTAHPMRIKINKASRFPLAYHFRGERSTMKPLFEEAIAKLAREIDVEYKIGKTYIGLIRTLVFAAFRIQTKKIIVEFTARKVFKSRRITSSKQFQKRRWAYFVDIRESQDIDKELINWIKQSHE